MPIYIQMISTTHSTITSSYRYSKSVDMWAIGCVLYTILCGFPPFYDESIPALTEKVARGQYTYLSPWWDTISDSVKDLISHLLCVDVRKRYTIDQFLDHPWIKQEPFIRNDHVPMMPAKKNQPLQAIAATNRYEQHKQEQREQQEIEAMIQQAAKSNILTPPDIEEDEDLVMDDDNSLIHTTPDAATLRGIFDITYAVQRMEEEQSLNNISKQQHRPLKPMQQPQPQHNIVQVPLAQQTHNLPMAQQLAKHSRGVADPINYRNHKPKNQQPAPTNMFGGPSGFHLDMNKATLLKNRQAMNMKA